MRTLEIYYKEPHPTMDKDQTVIYENVIEFDTKDDMLTIQQGFMTYIIPLNNILEIHIYDQTNSD
jgi:hypothetical protein